MIGTLQQAIDDMSHGIRDFTKNGKCTGCGQCCSRYLALSAGEIKDIKRYVEKHRIKEKRHIVPLANPVEDWTCPFLSSAKEKDKCAIYPVRPRICKAFQCNMNPQDVQHNKDLLYRARRTVDMRQEFFGN